MRALGSDAVVSQGWRGLSHNCIFQMRKVRSRKGSSTTLPNFTILIFHFLISLLIIIQNSKHFLHERVSLLSLRINWQNTNFRVRKPGLWLQRCHLPLHPWEVSSLSFLDLTFLIWKMRWSLRPLQPWDTTASEPRAHTCWHWALMNGFLAKRYFLHYVKAKFSASGENMFVPPA